MTPVFGATIWGATKKDIEHSFNTYLANFTKHTTTIVEEEKYTVRLEEEFNKSK
jgi:hypothetical protein